METILAPQFVFNIALTIVSFFSGWMLKVIFGLISRVQEDSSASIAKVQEDYRRLAEQVTDLAISLPQNYVSKDDFKQLLQAVHHRFDRLEEKVDSLKKV